MILRNLHSILIKIGAIGLVICLQFPTLLEWHHLFCEHDHSVSDAEASHHMDDEDDLCKLSDFQYSLLAVRTEIESFTSLKSFFKQQNFKDSEDFFSRTYSSKQLRAPPLLV